MSVEVVVPFRGGCSHRQRAWEWCRRRYRWPVTEAPGPDPWVKAAAVNPAIRASRADVVVVADADVFSDGLSDAVSAVAQGAAWAIPHHTVRRLSEEATTRLLRGEEWEELPLSERAHPGARGGGIVVARREALLEVPMDPRFVGFGGEDHSWGYALATLCGEPWRGEADLIHLYHPPQERLDRRWASLENRRLTRRYYAARRDPDAMRALLGEIPCP